MLGHGEFAPYITEGVVLAINDNEADVDAIALKGYVRSDLTDTLQGLLSLEFSKILPSGDNPAISSKSHNMVLSAGFRKLF